MANNEEPEKIRDWKGDVVRTVWPNYSPAMIPELVQLDATNGRVIIDGEPFPYHVAAEPSVTLVHASEFPLFRVSLDLYVNRIEFDYPEKLK